MEKLLAKLRHGPVLIYVEPGEEGFYEKLSFSALRTGMARFVDVREAREKGYIL
jgi:hypothetical protein